MNTHHTANAKIFKAFSDETRLMVLSLLQGGEKCACELLEQVSISQSTLSHHMKILVESGIVNARKEGKWMHYSICHTGCEKAFVILNKLTSNFVDVSKNEKECCAWIKNIVPKKSVAVQLM